MLEARADSDGIRQYSFAGEDPFADSILASRRRKSSELLITLINRSYLHAESVLGIATANGYRIRCGEELEPEGIKLLLAFFCEWFKHEFKADLHPLFPSVLEDMGYASDEARILDLWDNFIHEKSRNFLKQHPTLINLLVRIFFSDSLHQLQELEKVLQSHLRQIKEL